MYETAYHEKDLSDLSFLVTGGAGFIGSNLVEYLLHHGVKQLRVVDNLAEGKLENIEPFLADDRFEFMEADLTDPAVCVAACKDIDIVNHQAALGSVPRSIETPLATNAANVTAFLNMLTAAKDAGIHRFVYASSSSVYGDNPKMPKEEAKIGNPLSPYAATKRINEIYAKVFALNYGTEAIGLRYFNIFGPRQKPDGPYAAVIPLFMDALLQDRAPKIFGDGEQSRDFTFVANAVQANVRAMVTDNQAAFDHVFNIACGERATVNQLFNHLKSLVDSDLEPNYAPPRKGDIPHSLADISQARELLGYQPEVNLETGLTHTFSWFRKRFGTPANS